MDNPISESSNSPLDTNEAAAVFAEMLEPRKEEQEGEPQAVEAEVQEPEAETEETEVDAESSDEPKTVTVKIDGKEVEVTLDELKNGYQRQADYTRKTMEAAEQRKAADAEYQKAREERNQYAQKLNNDGALLAALLGEQEQTNWQQLLDADPVEYLRQQHLYQQRHAQLQEIRQAQQQVMDLQQQEQAQRLKDYTQSQRSLLLDKLPEWKDEGKAKAAQREIVEYLVSQGYAKNEITDTYDEYGRLVTPGVTDHRQVLLAQKAMLYDKMMSQAKAAAKKVQNVPQKVERAGNGNAPALDKRSSAYQRLSKSGKVEDAAAVFASLL